MDRLFARLLMDIKNTLYLRTFGLFKVPLIFSVRPTVEKLTNDHCEIRIPLNYWTRNHLKSMYFGTLAIGADCAGGLLAMDAIRRKKKKVSIVFKDLHADFLKRPHADVHFTCKDGPAVQKAVDETLRTKKRVNLPVHIIATTPKKSKDEPVAKFTLTLSLKAQE